MVLIDIKGLLESQSFCLLSFPPPYPKMYSPPSAFSASSCPTHPWNSGSSTKNSLTPTLEMHSPSGSSLAFEKSFLLIWDLLSCEFFSCHLRRSEFYNETVSLREKTLYVSRFSVCWGEGPCITATHLCKIYLLSAPCCEATKPSRTRMSSEARLGLESSSVTYCLTLNNVYNVSWFLFRYL